MTNVSTMSDWECRLRAAPHVLRDGTSDFDLNPHYAPPVQTLIPAAVLIGVNASGNVLLTRRAAHLKKHAGQISFPGGRQDAGETLTQTALREAFEETALPQHSVEVLGALPPHQTSTGYLMTPIVGLIDDFAPQADPGEVAEIFHVPLSHLTNPDAFQVDSLRRDGRERFFYAVPWRDYYIWGATARVLRSLAEVMR